MESPGDKPHLSTKRRYVSKIIYIIAVVIWILMLYALQVYRHRAIVGYVILAVPIFVFAMGFLSVGKITKEVRAQMFRADVVSVALLFITAILTSMDRDTHYTLHIMLVATVLVLLSLIDIWTGPKTIEFVQVTKSIFQTSAITLLVYVLYIRFTERLTLSNQRAATSSDK